MGKIGHRRFSLVAAAFAIENDLLCGMKKNKFATADRRDISIFLRQAFVHLDAWFSKGIGKSNLSDHLVHELGKVELSPPSLGNWICLGSKEGKLIHTGQMDAIKV